MILWQGSGVGGGKDTFVQHKKATSKRADIGKKLKEVQLFISINLVTLILLFF